MKYKLKRINLRAGKPIAFINVADAADLAVHPGERVLVKVNGFREIAIVDVTATFIRKGEVGLSQEVLNQLGLPFASRIEVTPASVAESSLLLKSKKSCDPYTPEQITKIIRDVVNGALSDAEIAYFISGVNYCGMSLEETKHLIHAIVSTGRTLSWGSKQCADKHSIGGIPGNRTTPIVVSICASLGVTMPKTSSRAITSAAGTADTMETLTKVDFSAEDLQRIVRQTGACLAWGGALGLAPADDKLIQVEKMLNLDPEPQLLASILAKKVAVGSRYVLIDIPYGPGAKVSRAKAITLKKKFLALGRALNLKLQTVLTDGSQPIGNGIGPALEMRDVLRVLQQKNSPQDLEKKSLLIAGKILEMTRKAGKGKGKILAKKALKDYHALNKFREIIEAQGGSIRDLPPAKYKKTFFASNTGNIKAIHNNSINMICRVAGCPQDKAAGLDLHAHTGNLVKKGDALATLYAESSFKLKAASALFIADHPIEIE